VATLRPFRALRPPKSLAPQVSAPPYDVVSTDEARLLAAGNPESFFHVSRPEIDLPLGTSEHDDIVYEQGARGLSDFIARGTLEQDAEPRLYVYAQTLGSHHQTGVVACASVQEYLDDRIKKHEKTRADKEDDRTRHIDTLGAHDEPVFLIYRASRDVDALVERVTRTGPEYDFVSHDGVRHVLWVVPAELTEALTTGFARVSCLFVADGHHRSASAARVHALRAGQPGEHDVFPAVIFPDDQVQILAYNRVVRDPRRRPAAELLEAFRARFDVTEAPAPAPRESRCLGLWLGEKWYWLRVRSGSVDERDPVASLDVSICQDQILAPLFDIQDPRRDERVGFVGGIRGAAELERVVSSGAWDLALHLFPTRVEQLIAVSEAGRLMPPKSTWFEPKLRSGLFVHTF
jgi:uncharacterized protein (DUF1015 family)